MSGRAKRGWECLSYAIWLFLWAYLVRSPRFCDESLGFVRSALNLIHFGSTAFNLGAPASTPGQWLWIVIIGFCSLFPGHLALAVVVCEGAFIAVGLAALAWIASSKPARGAEWLVQQIGIALLLAASSSVRTYLVSGLESSLVFGLLCVWGALMAGCGCFAGSVRSRWIVSVAGLSLLADPSLLLPVGVATLIWLAVNRRSWIAGWRGTAMSLLPVVIVFGIRKGAGIALIPKSPWEALVWRWDEWAIVRTGIGYLANAAAEEPITVFSFGVVIAVASWTLVRGWERSAAALLGFGTFLCIVWIVATGGSDMSGRLWVAPMAMACAGLMAAQTPRWSVSAMIVAFVATYFDFGKLLPASDRNPVYPHTASIFRQMGFRSIEGAGSTLGYSQASSLMASARRHWSNTSSNSRPSILVSSTPGADGLSQDPSISVLDVRLAAIPGVIPAAAGILHRSWSAVTRPPIAGALSLRLKASRLPEGSVEPILCAVCPTHSVRVTLSHLPAGGVRFGLVVDDYEYTVPLIRGFDYEKAHEVSVQFGQSVVGDSRAGAVILAVDGYKLREIPCRLGHYAPGDVVIGWNWGEGSGVKQQFAGDIDAVSSHAPASDWPWEPALGSEVMLTLRLAHVAGVPQPIASWGADGRNDIVFVRRLGLGLIEFGVEHKGEVPIYGAPVAIDDAKPHVIGLFLPPLFAGNQVIVPKNQLIVSIDGHVAFSVRKVFFDAPPHSLRFFDNPTVSSFVGQVFGDEVISITSRETLAAPSAIERELASGRGMIHLKLNFKEMSIGRNLAVLETGKTAAGDIVYVRRLDRTHIRFSFDHWGVGLIEGRPVEIDPDGIYDIGS